MILSSHIIFQSEEKKYIDDNQKRCRLKPMLIMPAYLMSVTFLSGFDPFKINKQLQFPRCTCMITKVHISDIISIVDM